MKKALVLGDVIIDHYTYGKKLGVSAETPTVVAEFQTEKLYVGGAGLVAKNLANLGWNVYLPTLFSEDLVKEFWKDDSISEDVKSLISVQPNVNRNGFLLNRKKRYYVDSYKLLQFDTLNHAEHNAQSRRVLENFVSYQNWDVVIICDNQHGMIDRLLAERVIGMCDELKLDLYVDHQVSQGESHFRWFRGAKNIVANDREWVCAAAEAGVYRGARSIMNEMRWKNAYVKRGSHGSSLITKDGKEYFSKGYKVECKDTCGAGDAFLAALVTTGNQDYANAYAACTVAQFGTVVPDLNDVEKLMKNGERS